MKLLGLSIVAGTQILFFFFIDFPFFFRKVYLMTTTIQDFHLFVFNIFAFNRITLSVAFGLAHDFYRRCNDAVYGIYGPELGNHLITCGPELLYLYFFSFYFFEVVYQNCHSTYNYDGVQNLKLLLCRLAK